MNPKVPNLQNLKLKRRNERGSNPTPSFVKDRDVKLRLFRLPDVPLRKNGKAF